MEERRCFALLGARLDFLPRAHEEFAVGFYFFGGGASGGGSNDESASTLTLGFVDEMAQAGAIFSGSDFARDAGVIERRHVDEIAAGKSDVTRDACAFFAERLFGDLDDDFLPLFQQVGNQLRTARRRAMAVAMASRAMLRAAATVGTSTAIVTASSVASSAARGVLHARAVIVLDASVPGLLFLGRLIFRHGWRTISGRSGFCGRGIGAFVRRV